MKMEIRHYQELEQYVKKVLTNSNIEEYRKKLETDPRVKDIEMRLRWDVLYAIPARIRIPLMDELYKYLNDTHIDTALKALMRAHYNQSARSICNVYAKIMNMQ